MWIDRLRAAPWAMALAAALLAVPWAQAQRVRQFPSMAFRTGMTANQMTSMNSVMFPRTVFNPPFYSVLAARNPLLLASGLTYASPFFNNMGYGVYSSMANPYLRNSLLYNRMLYGTYGMGYGGYGGYGMGYGYNPALYSGAYGGYSANNYSANYSPAGSAYQPAYAASTKSAYAPNYSKKYGESESPYAASVAAGKFEMKVTDGSISDEKITIPAGTTVTWSNQGERSHTIAANDDTWHVTLRPTESFGLKFADRGTYQYHVDAKSDTFAGVIVVK